MINTVMGYIEMASIVARIIAVVILPQAFDLHLDAMGISQFDPMA